MPLRKAFTHKLYLFHQHFDAKTSTEFLVFWGLDSPQNQESISTAAHKRQQNILMGSKKLENGFKTICSPNSIPVYKYLNDP